jgi:radical SAM protein with 4Fe4S-binding SPASM domain
VIRSARRARRLGIPVSAQLTLTYRCQHRCAHCYQTPHGGEELSTAEVVSLLDDLAALGVLELTFTGGEFLLRDDAFELLAEARRRAFSATLFTNGWLVDGAAARRLGELRLRGVELSIHGVRAEVHDGIADRPGSFDRVLRATDLLLAQGLPVIIKGNLLSVNADGLLDLRRLFPDHPRLSFLNDPLLFPRADGDPLVTLRSRPEQLRPYYAEDAARLSDEELAGLLARIGRPADRSAPVCGLGSTGLTVLPNGDVVACEHLPSHRLGNLRQHALASIWREAPALLAVRAHALGAHGACADCSAVDLCSLCPAQSWAETGSLGGLSAQVCERTKAMVGAALEEAQRRSARAP